MKFRRRHDKAKAVTFYPIFEKRASVACIRWFPPADSWCGRAPVTPSAIPSALENKNPMKIYDTKRAPNPRRVRMFLAEKDIAMEYVEVDLTKGEHMSAEFKQKNPMKKVPVLEFDDGTHLSESIAICRYFEEVQPEPPLMGSTPREKAEIEMWLRHLEFFFMFPTGMCFQHTSGFFAQFRKTFPEWGEENRAYILKFLDYLNKHLADHRYIMGDQFSIADISAFCTLDFNKVNNIRVQPEQQPHLQRWYDDMRSRPSAQA